MDWTQEELALANAPNMAAAMQSLVTWLDGMPIENAPIGPAVDPMASLPATPALTPQDAPAGTSFLPGNMPITGPVNLNPPVTLDDFGHFVPAPTSATLHVDPVATALAAPGVTVYAFGDGHGGGNG